MAAENRPDLMGARGILALGVATVGSIVCAMAVAWVSSSYLERLHPQNRQDGVHAIFAGVLSLPVTWVVLFFAVRWIVGALARPNK